MIRRLPPALLLALALPPAALAAGAAGERQEPVHLRADRIEIDQKKGVSHYQGHVQLTQGTLRVTADRADAKQRGDLLENVIATGKPVTFRDRPEGQTEFIDGKAARAEYDAPGRQIYLSGGVDITRGHDNVRAASAHYDMNARAVHAERDAGQRVYMALTPRSQQAGNGKETP